MPTDEERRVVALRLRYHAKTVCHSPEYLWIRTEMAVNGWSLGAAIDGSYVYDNDVLSRLADLIDPQELTCHNEATGDFFCCSECGTHFGIAVPRGSRKAMPTMKFCPSCGALITEVDDDN